MTIREPVEVQAARGDSSTPIGRWPLTTVLWSAVAFAVPINYVLPSAIRTLWFVAIMGLIGFQVLFLRVARPLYPAIWVLAGFASLVAILTATDTSTIEENLFVGVQLIVLLGFGVFVLTANAITDQKFVQRVSVAFLIGESSSAAVAVFQLLGRSLFASGAVNGRAQGLAEHPNTLGLTAAVASLLALRILFVTRRSRVLVIGALILNLMALGASGSLSSMIAFALGVVVLIVCFRYHLLQIALGAIGFALVVWVVGTFSGLIRYLPSLTERYKQVTGQTAAEGSWALRKRTLDFAWGRIIEEPSFGNGLSARAGGSFNGVTTVHNLVLRGWYQGGVLLGIALAAITIAVLVVAVRAMIRREHGGEASILVAIFVFASMSPVLEQRHYWLMILMAWASISASLASRRRATPT
jgi:O-antigen ligase